jgi:hypothetical protein
MIAQYPRFVPHPAKNGKLHRVENADDHKRINPEDYAAFELEQKGDPTKGRGAFIGTANALEERERCALVAETFPENGKAGGKPTKLGALIAAAIRGQAEDLAHYPKVLRNPELSIVKVDKFTQPGPKPETFIRPDVTVKDPIEETEARGDGYVVVVSDATLPQGKQVPGTARGPVLSEFPKILRDPTSQEKPSEGFTELRAGRYFRPDITVHNLEEEEAAKTDGYSQVISRSSPVEGGAAIR